MLVISPYHPGDADQALRLFRWISELEGRQMSHDLMLIADTRCSPATVSEIEATARQSFRTVETLSFVDHYKRWPDAPNSVFATGARHVMANQRVPWLFLEPDCCPLKAGWLDAIEAEYKAAGKPFMGARVEVNEVPLHMSGNGVYPADMFAHGGNALIAGDIAWDVAAASQIVPQAHFTKLLEHAWKHPTFESQEQIDREVSKEAVVYHASKDGSLIRLLRERKNNLSGATSADTRSTDGTGSEINSKPSTHFTTDILIKSYPPDYERLAYCLRSIGRFAHGFRQVVLVCPAEPKYGPLDMTWENQPCVIPQRVTSVIEPVDGDGYLFQNAIKASAHEYTDADYVLHLDSDCILTKPITPETFFRNGKPIWMLTPYADIQAGIDAQKAKDPNFHCGSMTWKLITEKFMGEQVEFEYMRRMPMFVPRSLHVAAAEFCKIKHGVTLTEYILSQPAKEFSEFNALGALAYSRARNDFYWLDTTKEPLPETVCIQEWSHAPFTAERKTEFELILSGSGEKAANAANVDPPAQTICPAGSRSLEQIIDELKPFCDSGAQTRRVRLELHRAGIIELPYRNRKRKGWRKKRAA